ncbi:asparagine synthase (glutamine-hydrolyzing) [Thermosulfurimonas dismutans]|uniref:asparagine synthase (glutamine-hydrolyzing) n=1 Tax=Thermosulfurimonas dismutans TaxID=999894 RepID=A0A179D5X2_9BACT|nr:asparagine synthase (glutamine-hydrolyzing) [Thermosulfurimonas dismutans]OAQ21129.1 Asparagine synthetase [glutamine-hydrolyzing] [Thermosulfurimonas dismutans]
MCGINGIVRFEERIETEEIKYMNRVIRHRGPDDEGMFLWNSNSFSVGLGHVRLAILDLSVRGHQPMGYSVEDDRVIWEEQDLHRADFVIVYNGEVYNYLELKEELGLLTETGTDTEVILKTYARFGPRCVERFNGMWSFCILDRRKGRLFCSRDRLGVKPFYYFWNGKEFIFSSELKGILAVKPLNSLENLDSEALELYFSLGFIPAPWSIYRGIQKLEARQNLFLDLATKRLWKSYYWELPDYDPLYDKKALIEEGKALIQDAVRIRMRSDVPVGAFLSGGLDSSSVVSMMRRFTDLSKLHTFSIGFEGKYDETPYIREGVEAFGTRHHHYYFKEPDFEKLLEIYSRVYDEPFGDYSGFPTYKVSEMARRHVTVVLSGDGGDEIFGGYWDHLNGYRMEILYKLPRWLRKLGAKIPARKNLNPSSNLYLLKEAFRLSLSPPERFFADSLPEDAYRPPIYREWTTEKLRFCLPKAGGSLAEALRIFDLLYNTLPDYFLTKVDRASMANALEVRSPFLDYRFVEFSQRIPTCWKVDLFKTKKLMREIIKDIVPEIIVQRSKQGFIPPIEEWILREKWLKSFLAQALGILEGLSFTLYKFLNYHTLFSKKFVLYRVYLIRTILFLDWYFNYIEHTGKTYVNIF